MEKTTMTVELLNGKYTVNGKEMKDMNSIELQFFFNFYRNFKEVEKEQPKKKMFDWGILSNN